MQVRSELFGRNGGLTLGNGRKSLFYLIPGLEVGLAIS